MKVFKNFNLDILARVINLMGNKKYLFLGFIGGFSVMEIGCSILFAFGIKGIITAISASNSVLFWESMIYLFIKELMWWGFTPISSYVSTRISKNAICNIKTNLCTKVLSLPMKYHDSKAKGELLSSFSNDIDGLQGIFDWRFSRVLSSITGGLGGIIIMLYMDWRLGLIVILLGLLSIYISSFYNKKLSYLGEERQKSLAENNTDAYEFVKAAKTIRVFGLRKIISNKYSKSIQLEETIKIKSGIITARMKAINLGISSLTYILIIFVGALFVYYKLTDWGTVVAIAGLKYTASMLFKESSEHMAGMQKEIAASKRLFTIFDTFKEEFEKSLSFRIKNSKFPVSLDRVSFSYDGIIQVIENLSISFEKNKLNVLKGQSGVGKSTIMKLILGLYSPQKGAIIFDGEEELSLKCIREKTAYVPQEPILFRESIYENVKLGSKEASKESVITTAKMAGVLDFATKLSKGIDTVLLDDGANLSGGEKQRIMIARALLKNSPILLLDEITSALDPKTEKKIMETIKQISKGRTVIFITHKEEVAIWGDKIIQIGS